MGNKDSKINQLEECCKNDNSARFSEVVSKEFLQKAYESSKNDGGWRTVGAYLLCVAVQREAIQCLRIILGNGVSADVKGKGGVTPLYKAAGLNSPNVAKVLLEHGAQVNATTCSGYSPIHRATRGGNVETLLLLCSVEDAHLNLKTGSEGWTPLHIAVDYGSNGPECVRILLDFGASADIRDSLNKTARELAVKRGHQDILDSLNKAAATTPEEGGKSQSSRSSDNDSVAVASPPQVPAPVPPPRLRSSATPTDAAAVQSEVFVSVSSPTPNLPSPASYPWRSKAYIGRYAQLIRTMPPDEVKTLCYTLMLISDGDLEYINSERTCTLKNEAILRFVARSSSHFGKFREVLHHVDVCCEVAKHLDKIGPRRNDDEGCLEARRILNR